MHQRNIFGGKIAKPHTKENGYREGKNWEHNAICHHIPRKIGAMTTPKVRGDAPKEVQMEPKSASRNELGEGGSDTSKSRECACSESWWPKKTWPLKALRELLCPRREGRTQDEVPRRQEACAACQGICLYPHSIKPLKDVKQGSGIIRFSSLQDHSLSVA